MRSEHWSWTSKMRDASLWLSHAGRLFASWGWAGQAHRLLYLRDLEDALGKSDAAIVVVGQHDDREVYRIWSDPAVDVVIVFYRSYVGIFRPPQFGVRREYYSGVQIETADGHWWVTDGGLVTAALEWRDVLGLLADQPDAEAEAEW